MTNRNRVKRKTERRGRDKRRWVEKDEQIGEKNKKGRKR